MIQTNLPDTLSPVTLKPIRSVKGQLRFYFLTGIVVAAPLVITAMVVHSVIRSVDAWMEPLLPADITRLAVPGLGLILAVISVTLIGALTANVVGRFIVSHGDRLIARVPFFGSIYKPVRQVFDALMKPGGQSFREVVLIEYPGPGSESLAFITGDAPEILGPGKVTVFLPTSPSIYTGFLLYMNRDKIKPVDMTVEHAIQIVISAGLAGGKSPVG